MYGIAYFIIFDVLFEFLNINCGRVDEGNDVWWMVGELCGYCVIGVDVVLESYKFIEFMWVH